MNGIFAHGRDLRALREHVDALAGDRAATSARIDAIERDAVGRDGHDALVRRVDEGLAAEGARHERIDALERRIAAQAETLGRLGEALRARDATIEALRIEIAKVQRQAAIDLDEVRSTARALAELLLRSGDATNR